MRDRHFYNLDKEWDTFVEYLKGEWQTEKVPFMAPDKPANFVDRPTEFNELIRRLLKDERQNPVAITTALRGACASSRATPGSASRRSIDGRRRRVSVIGGGAGPSRGPQVPGR
jgi:hypothetical protein